MAIEEQVEANRQSLQAIADEALSIGQLLPKAIPAELVDKFAIEDKNGVTIYLTLQQVADLISAQSASVVNYAALSSPQAFNPDGTDVSNGFADFTLSSSNQIGFVSVNGQVIDDSEYSLLASVLTVTPDNGFFDVNDEVLVFQFTFSTVGVGGVKYAYTTKTANYTITEDDYYVECTSNTFNVTLPNPATVGAGKTFSIKNSGTGTIDIIANLDQYTVGDPLQLDQNESVTVASTNSKYIIV